jgi:hypothetical protein
MFRISCAAVLFAGCTGTLGSRPLDGDSLGPGDTGSDGAQPEGDQVPADTGTLGDPNGGGDSSSSSDEGSGDAPVLTAPDECATMQPNWIFCSAFEEGNKDIWDDYDGNPDATNQLLADPGPFDLSGNHVMRLYPPEGRGGADLVKVLPSQHDRLFARWYMKWDAAYDFGAANHGSGLHAGSRDLLGHSDFRPDGDDWFTAWIEPDPAITRLYAYSYYRGMYQDCANPDGACWGDHLPCMTDEGQTFCEKPQHRETVLPPVMVTDRWYCIEMMLDGGTPVPSEAGANGRLDWWIDGLEIGPWTDLWLRTTSALKVSILWLNLFHHGDHADAGVVFDNVVVATERVGCLGR